jgi:hypothetical protein
VNVVVLNVVPVVQRQAPAMAVKDELQAAQMLFTSHLLQKLMMQVAQAVELMLRVVLAGQLQLPAASVKVARQAKQKLSELHLLHPTIEQYTHVATLLTFLGEGQVHTPPASTKVGLLQLAQILLISHRLQ